MKLRYRNIIQVTYLLAVSLFLTMCANPVSPTGGPKDTQQPVVVKSEPPLYTKNFSSKKIRIYFDEFIVLNDIKNQVIISPPMLEMPEFKTRGKSVLIELKEELNENTTYNIFFGDGIADLTENNPVINFRYVFSTGDILDSLSIEGNVNNAFSMQPEEDINVMLYIDNSDTVVFDSVPYVLKPYYMTKTNASGNYVLSNLPDHKFKIFALKDVNSNLLYDQPNEEIAFIDSLIIPYYKQLLIPDSVLSDSILTDTAAFEMPVYKTIDMALFHEVDSTQRLMKAVLTKKAQLNFIFKFPTNNLQIRPLNFKTNLNWKIEEFNKTNDTITYWLLNINQDSLIFEISDRNEILDTVEIAIVKKSKGKKAKKEKEKETEKPQSRALGLNIGFSMKGGSFDLHKPLFLTSNYPVIEFDSSGILLIEAEDTLSPEIIFADNIKRKAKIEHKWKEATKYSLIIPQNAFTDILEQTHDTIARNFTTKSFEDYGNLYIDVQIVELGYNYIIQLLKDDKIIKELILNDNQRIAFEYLDPGSYQVKVIYDKNNNKRWDTGDYIKKLQPEKVDFFPAEITVRANWDIEEEWGI
ncbi:MAG: Ig-like domain-containing protein [Bacteroidales bacterium]|nr:Ig-like domain-containing protein [Bacteroidales bacterium]